MTIKKIKAQQLITSNAVIFINIKLLPFTKYKIFSNYSWWQKYKHNAKKTQTTVKLQNSEIYWPNSAFLHSEIGSPNPPDYSF